MPSFKPADIAKAAPFEQDTTAQKQAGVSNVQMTSHNIKTVHIDKTHTVNPYNSQALRETEKQPSYSSWKRTFVNQEEQKNSRFKLNELSRANMSVEEEEEIRIEAEVQRRIGLRLRELEERTQAQAQGEGFAQGLLEGKHEAEILAKPVLDKVMALLESLNNVTSSVAQENEEFIIKMVYQIARKIILREIEEDKDYVRRAVTHILAKINLKDNVKIFVSPKEIAGAEKLKSDLVATIGEMRNLTIEIDPRLTGGGCRVETEFGNIDATIEAQLANLATVLHAT